MAFVLAAQSAVQGETAIRDIWDEEEKVIAEEYLAHARALRAERDLAAKEGRPAQIIRLLQSWGGATIAYRKRLIDSPSYTLNHEEVEKALEEGIWFAEGMTPSRVNVDVWGHIQSAQFSVQKRDDAGQWQDAGQVGLPARALLVDQGLSPVAPFPVNARPAWADLARAVASKSALAQQRRIHPLGLVGLGRRVL